MVLVGRRSQDSFPLESVLGRRECLAGRFPSQLPVLLSPRAVSSAIRVVGQVPTGALFWPFGGYSFFLDLYLVRSSYAPSPFRIRGFNWSTRDLILSSFCTMKHLPRLRLPLCYRYVSGGRQWATISVLVMLADNSAVIHPGQVAWSCIDLHSRSGRMWGGREQVHPQMEQSNLEQSGHWVAVPHFQTCDHLSEAPVLGSWFQQLW
jgi:hypothetical protein